ncbi:YsnF/AvaK domain-containing protein [Singulisphaera sp. PoT]|uniref:YsnF/AvaK domain-containing protein n=1 Tax=Singulisphaera sp. PoT TaxID=3411797 RepID=UPI003BF510F8
MTTRKNSTVVGVFSDRLEAEQAIDALLRVGFTDDQIGIATRGDHGETHLTEKLSEGHESRAETGAIAGAVTGAGLGALAGLGILAGVIPVIGPAIAGGTLAVILANAAGGAAVAGLAGALIGSGIPEDEAEYYNREFEGGRTILTVKAEGRADEANQILRSHHAYDMLTSSDTVASGEACSTTSKTSKTRATSPTSRTLKDADLSTLHRGDENQRIQVKEEELHATKHPVETGEVRVRKEVHTEHKTLDVPIRKEEIIIERHAVSGRETATSDLKDGEEIRVPVMEERVTVEKTPVVKEEVTVGKRVIHETERVSGDVRKEELKVEQSGKVEVKGNARKKS